jgi:DNA polymerase III sliding clamp (beta) subunit (PCNA family)
MAVSPINTGTTGSTTPTAGGSTTVLAKLFNQIIQKILNDATENANNQ